MLNTDFIGSQLIDMFQQIIRNMLYSQQSHTGKGTSCSCSMALWISPGVIARFGRDKAEDCMFDGEGGLGMPERRIEERRFGGMEGEICGDSEGIVGL